MILNSQISPSLKSLRLFEDFNPALINIVKKELSDDCPSLRPSPYMVGAALAKRSLSLEQVSASFMVEADDFFRECQPDWVWTKLKFISLTSRLLKDRDTQRAAMDTMLCTAAAVAKNMPKLKIMEIWSGEKWDACLFRYEAQEGIARLT